MDKIYIQATTKLSTAEEKELQKAITRIFNKRKKLPAEVVPMYKWVYVMDIHADSIMTTGSADLAGVVYIAGNGNINALLRQLEQRYGKKFYCEEVKEGDFDKKRLINKVK